MANLNRIVTTTCLFGLLAWAMVQCIPLGPSLHRILHPRLWAAFPEILADCVQYSIALDTGQAVMTIPLWCAYGLLILMAARMAESRNASRMLVGAIVLVALAQAVYGILTLGSPAAGQPFPVDRMRGTFSGPNALGGLLALGIPACLGLLMSAAARITPAPVGRRVLQWVHVLTSTSHGIVILVLMPCLSVLIVALFLTASRGALMATAVAATLLLAVFAKRQRRAGGGISLAAFVLLVGAAVAFVGAGGVYALLVRRLDTLESGSDISFRARVAIIRGVLELLWLHPFGVGPGCFATAFTRFQEAGHAATRVYKAHNDYLHTLTELGIPGVLLAAPLAVVVLRTARSALTPNSRQPAVWLWAGMGASVFAGLLHAAVDFNLTSRPGVAVAYCLALGLLVGRNRDSAGDTHPHRSHGNDAKPHQHRQGRHTARRNHGRAWFLRAPLLVPSMTLAMTAAVWLHSELTSQQAYHALGGTRDNYFWLTPHPTAPRANARAIEAAVRVLPFNAEYRQSQGRARLLMADRDIASKLTAALAANAGGAATNQIEALVELASRPERRAANMAAAEAFACAVAMVPWEPAYRLDSAHALARICLPEITNDVIYGEAAVQQARKAAVLAPNNGYVLALAAEATATSIQRGSLPEATLVAARTRTREWGIQAVNLDPASREIAFAAMLRAGANLSDLIESAALPARSLWILYTQLRDSHHPLTARTLAALSALLEQPDRTVAAASFAHEHEVESLDKLRARVARERMRVMLATGDIAAYRNALDRRVALWQNSIAEAMNLEQNQWTAIQHRAPTLRNLYASRGLPPDWQRWLAITAASHDGSTISSTRLLFESCLPQILYGLTVAPDIAALQLRTSEALSQKHFTAIVAALTETPNSGDPLHRFHGMAPPDSWRSIQAAMAIADAGPAQTIDPVALARITSPDAPLHELAAPLRIDTAYLGGRFILLGIDAYPRAIDAAVRGCSVTTYWQINGIVPPDAVLILRALDESGGTLSSTSIAFATAAPSIVRLQDYQVGQVIRISNVLSARALAATSLRLQLWQRQAQRTLPTLEGLSTIEIGAWPLHMRPLVLMAPREAVAPSTRASSADVAAEVDARLAAAWGHKWPFAIQGAANPVPLSIIVERDGKDALAGLDLATLETDTYLICARQDGIHVVATTDAALSGAVNQLAALLADPVEAEDGRTIQTRRNLSLVLYDPIWHIGIVGDRTDTDDGAAVDDVSEPLPPP